MCTLFGLWCEFGKAAFACMTQAELWDKEEAWDCYSQRALLTDLEQCFYNELLYYSRLGDSFCVIHKEGLCSMTK